MSEDKKMIYLDNAATTRTDPKVVEAMLPYFTEYYGNPSSVYEFSGISKKAVTDAREILARSIGAKTQEIYFTAGGSESDNWAIKAAAEAFGKKGKHIITSKIEHHAVLHTCEYLEKQGYEVTYLDVDENGSPRYEDALKVAVNRHDLSVIEVYDPRERTVPDVGLVHVKDSETGRCAWVNTSSRRMRRAYSDWFAGMAENTSRMLMKYSIDNVSISTDDDYVRSLMTFFQRR